MKKPEKEGSEDRRRRGKLGDSEMRLDALKRIKNSLFMFKWFILPV